MDSIILRTTARILLLWMMVFSWWVLFRGHNAPGGGFAGGLIAASALSLYVIAYDMKALRAVIKFSPFVWLGSGLFIMLFSGLLAYFKHEPFLSGIILFGLNTTVLFDFGVYLTVCFSIVVMMIALESRE